MTGQTGLSSTHCTLTRQCHTSDEPFVLVRLDQRYDVSKAQLEVLASQWVLTVVLDQRRQAGKVEVGREKEVGSLALRTFPNQTVLDPPTAPETHTEPGDRCGD